VLKLIKIYITKKYIFKFQVKSFKTFCLQEIRRHLRQKRPQDITSYDASLEDDDNSDGVEEILEGGEEADGEGGTGDYGVANVSKAQSGQESSIETITENTNIEKEGRHVENQTKHSHDHQHNRNHYKGDQHRGSKKPKSPVVTTMSTVTGEDSVRQDKTHEKKFDETLFEEYDSEGSQGSSLVTTEHSRLHHRHHHYSPNSGLPFPHSINTTTDPSAHVDSAVEVTLDYLDLNFTEGPSTEYSVLPNSTTSNSTSQQRVKLSKPTASNENKVSFFFFREARNMLAYNGKVVSIYIFLSFFLFLSFFF
jgi:hypothetical protein